VLLHGCEDAIAGSLLEISLADASPVLLFELGPGCRPVVVPLDSLFLPFDNGRAEYSLKGIIYSGVGHFSARLITSNGIWTYDGQIDKGRPHFKGFSLDMLLLCELDKQQAHLCVYALKKSAPIDTAESPI
jgi:hypothetical protein